MYIFYKQTNIANHSPSMSLIRLYICVCYVIIRYYSNTTTYYKRESRAKLNQQFINFILENELNEIKRKKIPRIDYAQFKNAKCFKI